MANQQRKSTEPNPPQPLPKGKTIVKQAGPGLEDPRQLRPGPEDPAEAIDLAEIECLPPASKTARLASRKQLRRK